MPDENINSTDVLSALDNLEDYCLENHLARSHNYNLITTTLETEGHIDVKVLERILAVCVHDLKEDLKNIGVIMNLLPLLIKKVKEGKFDQSLNLLPSALAVLGIINTTALMNKVDTLKGLCFDTLLSYPDATLITAVEQDHLEVLEVFTLYCHTRVPNNVRLQACGFLHKLLMILPPPKKRFFIGKGISVWFSKIIPTAMAHVILHRLDHEMCVEILELLTEDLVHFEYTEDIYWKTILECISQPTKYPFIMKTLLQQGSASWHRLWIVFIKLLKYQITQSLSGVGTPINSMLPVVEAAFKVDVAHRCKAFECWNVLIDSFAMETNESNVCKRIKLLVIPLQSNNAKVEETAIAKFRCWWHLIVKFQTKMDRFLDMIIVSFLRFIFGKHNTTDKNTVVPGQINVNVKRQTIKAIVDLVGHVDCDGCTSLPKLNKKIINPKHLVDNWSHWVYSLTSAIMIAANEDDILTRQQLRCLWKSFILTIGELPDNYIRKDLFYEMLSIVKHLIQKSEHKSKLADIAFNILLISLFDGDESIKTLLKTKNGDNNPMNETLNILQETSLKDFYRSHDTRELVTKLRCITNLVVDKHFNPTYVVGRFLAELPGTDMALILWTAVAESVFENERMCVKNLNSLLLWPLRHLEAFSDVKLAAMTWYRLYNLVHSKISKTDIDEEIMKSLLAPKEYTSSVSYYTLCALLAVIKNKFSDEQFTRYYKEAELLEILIKSFNDYKSIEQLFPIMVDTLVLFLHNVSINIDDILATHAINCFKSVLKITSEELTNQCNEDHTLISFGNVLTAIDKLVSQESYSKLISVVADDLLNALHSSVSCKQSSIKSIVLNLINNIMHKTPTNYKTPSNKIKASDKSDEDVSNPCTDVEVIDSNEVKEVNKSENSKFTTPTTKQVPKKSKKKEPSIVSTVLENGEEYVVVKSNWKFNPRKLTENQKEKLKRKREDIPALYQDLSQSQDEFQLVPWKSDSQDTSSSKSESKSNVPTSEDTATILKNLPSSEVVPNILENLTKKDNINSANDVLPIAVSNKIETSTNKNTKSPRMALKDRVFRNVRNLIEKSSLQKENQETNEQTKQSNNTPAVSDSANNKSGTIVTTPGGNKIKIMNSMMNSAPPLLSADRPSRVKRKPKKFDDLELLALKRKRNSLQSTQSGDKSNVDKKEVNNDEKSIDKESVTTIDSVHINETELKQNTIEVLDKDPIDKIANVIQNIEVNHLVLQTDCNEGDKIKDDKLSENTVKETEHIKPINNTDNEAEPEKETLIVTTVKDLCDISTPKQSKEITEAKSTAKKSSAKKSRIEKELAIDMVEGHPFLKMQSEKRITRKNAGTPPLVSCKRKGLAKKKEREERENKSKIDSTTPSKSEKKNENVEISLVVHETQENSDLAKDSSLEDIHCSEDVIESSQESTFSTLSVKSAKKTAKKIPFVALEKIQHTVTNKENIDVSQSILDCGAPTKVNHDSKDDIELPVNKTAEEVQNPIDLTENMDTEPVNEDEITADVIIINDDLPAPMTVSSDDTIVGPETQEIAEADTQPTDPNDFMDTEVSDEKTTENVVIPDIIENPACNKDIVVEIEGGDKVSDKSVNIQDDKTVTLSESLCAEIDAAEVSSPFKDDVQRKKDFLNNTIEISPIKTMSPDRDKKSPSPDNSSDYVVIKLTSPVHSNGEPFEKCGSPEFFTDDKVSPDKRDQSPPRVEVSVTNTSPSSSLSLKKNRPQVRSGGRAAQMLGLCVPDKLHTIINQDRNEPEEAKKCSPSNTTARRNLRILYNTVQTENGDNTIENEDPESFLKFKRTLPSVDSSPSGPILKRKIGEITDDTTISPASKRKRVSFHDPPVSTTISVQKYIEPIGVRSPQNSALKRLERQLRQYTPVKSPKRLENVFKLDSALTQTLESFAEVDALNPVDDTQVSSLDETPLVEIVKASELNDTDPICPDLLECKDPIDNIASELSSPAMKSLLIKELEGKVETVGDLAKMTELEVNRLCIKAPKVKVAMKVLTDYASKKSEAPIEAVTINEAMFDETMHEPVDVPMVVDIEIQTDTHVASDMEVQTTSVPVIIGSTQTEVVPTSHITIQTDESGEQSTEDLIKSRLLKRPDFIQVLSEQLEEASIRRLSDKLPFTALTDVFMAKVTPSDSNAVLNRILEQRNDGSTCEQRRNTDLTFLQDYIVDRFDSKDLILFCSKLLQRLHDKPA